MWHLSGEYAIIKITICTIGSEQSDILKEQIPKAIPRVSLPFGNNSKTGGMPFENMAKAGIHSCADRFCQRVGHDLADLHLPAALCVR